MSRLIGSSIRAALCGLAFLTTFADASNATSGWPAVPSQTELETPYGTLGIKLNDYIYESRLHINNTDTDPPIEGLLNITYAFQLKDAQAALLSVSQGDNQCPVEYRWVILSKDAYKISPVFGSCSEQIKVTAEGQRFTVQTPSTQTPEKIDVYTYDGKTVKHKTQP